MKLLMIEATVLKEKMRRFSFWGIAAVALVVAFLCVPTTKFGDLTLLSIEPDVYQQASNPSWIPNTAALIMAFLLPLLGFVYVHGTVKLDRQTGTMDMLLASGVGRFRYVFGKLLAGFTLLILLLGIVMAGSLVTMLMNFHGKSISAWAFVSPFLALVPGLLFTAALSLLLETAGVFRRGNMDALAMLLFVVCYFVSVFGLSKNSSGLILDFTGFGLISLSQHTAEIKATGKPALQMGIGVDSGGSGKIDLYFSGLPRQTNVFVSMAMIVVVALLLAVLAALLLEKRPVAIKQKKQLRVQAPVQFKPAKEGWQPVAQGKFNFLAMIKSEFIRLTADLNLWWYLASLALWLVCWVIEDEIVRGILLPILIGVAILPLSHLGSEEQQTGVEEWLQTIPGALLRQAIVSGLTGILMVVFLIFPVLIRSFSYGFPAVLVLFSFAVCLPLLALFLGTYTKIERPFQLILLVFLYLLLNDPEMCLPISGGSVAVMLLFYLVVAGISMSAVIVKQKKQML